MKSNLQRILAIIAVVAIALVSQYFPENENGKSNNGTSNSLPFEPIKVNAPKVEDKAQLLQKIADANEKQTSGWWLTAEVRVIALLKDDLKGSKHQKFLIELVKGTTLLVSHNIDLAPRVPIDKGEMIAVCGRYEWNHRGGVVHWTHHDPRGKKEGGWIYSRGQYYK